MEKLVVQTQSQASPDLPSLRGEFCEGDPYMSLSCGFVSVLIALNHAGPGLWIFPHAGLFQSIDALSTKPESAFSSRRLTSASSGNLPPSGRLTIVTMRQSILQTLIKLFPIFLGSRVPTITGKPLVYYPNNLTILIRAPAIEPLMSVRPFRSSLY